MRKYGSDLAFIDLLFALLLGIMVLFILAYLLINPPADHGKVDPPVQLLIELEWPDNKRNDMDLWVRGHAPGYWIGYQRKEAGYLILERDDLGYSNDTYNLNGEEVAVNRNYEVVTLTALPPGEYFINVHHFSKTSFGTTEVTVRVTQIEPYGSIWKGNKTLGPNQEVTMVSFRVDANKKIYDIRTDIQMPAGRNTGAIE